MLASSSATALLCIWKASMPLAYRAPTTLPALVPATKAGSKPLASSILITPIWAKPLAAPPPGRCRSSPAWPVGPRSAPAAAWGGPGRHRSRPAGRSGRQTAACGAEQAHRQCAHGAGFRKGRQHTEAAAGRAGWEISPIHKGSAGRWPATIGETWQRSMGLPARGRHYRMRAKVHEAAGQRPALPGCAPRSMRLPARGRHYRDARQGP